MTAARLSFRRRISFSRILKYCRVAQQFLPCYKTAARPEFNGRATAVLKLHLIRSNEFDTIAARRLQHASEKIRKSTTRSLGPMIHATSSRPQTYVL